MRLLYIATSFPTEEEGATIYTDLAEAIWEAGHEITVVVAEQRKRNRRVAMERERGFEVLRIPVGNYYEVGFVEKGITMLKQPVLLRRGIRSGLTTYVSILYGTRRSIYECIRR